MPIRQRKIYWSSDLQLHVSYTRWHAMRGSEVHFTRLRMGFETGEYPRKISGQFFGKQRLNACVDSQGWADKSDRTFGFEIPARFFSPCWHPKGRYFIQGSGSRSVGPGAVAEPENKNVERFSFRGLRAGKRTRNRVSDAPRLRVVEAWTRVSAPSPSSTRAVLASFPGAREKNERQRRR